MPAKTETASSSTALYRFAIACAIATFILIFVGGLVTSTGSALAVPDWPLAFGRLIPPLEGSIRFEWGHRVVAGTVSILTLILALWTWWVEPRRAVRITALAALALVIVQAVLGGLTVLMLLPLPLAVAHAATAQAFFCLMIAMVVLANPGYGQPIKNAFPHGRPALAVLTTVTTLAIYVQILVGAVMRHLGAGLAIPDFPTSYGRLVPPFYSLAVGINFAHRCGALIVASLIIWTFARVLRFYGTDPQLRNRANLLLALLSLQITLGALTVWTGRAILPTTAHVAIGAAVLGTSLALTIRAYEIRVSAKASEFSPMPSRMPRQVSA